MAAPRRGLLMALCLALSASATAQTQSAKKTLQTAPSPILPAPQSTAPHSAANPPNSGAPSLEFLEFLGEFETTDGQWHDPVNEIQTLDKAVPTTGRVP